MNMEVNLTASDAEIKIEELPDGNRRITIHSDKLNLSHVDRSIETCYSVDLIEKILSVKGPRTLNDEIRRDQDPLYTKACLEYDITAYQPGENFINKRILDFGCGAGASTFVLSRLFPDAQIVGIELSDELLSLARARAQFYNNTKVSFFCSTDSKTLPDKLGKFDYVVLSAVFEHLLPDERQQVLGQIWSLMNPGGIFFLNQTPYRFFPFEGHTSHLFFINYLPKKLAHFYARRFSKRVSKNETWENLLRRGIRGGRPTEIMRILKKADTQHTTKLMKPSRLGFRDRIDVWYAGYAQSIAKKYPKMKNVQKLLRTVAKIIYKITGIVVLPTVSVAFRKQNSAQSKST